MSFFPVSAKAYLHAAMSGDQTYANDAAVDYNTAQEVLGIIDQTNGRWRLPAGGIYQVTAAIYYESSSIEFLVFTLFDVTGAADFGIAARIPTTSNAGNQSMQSIASGIIDCTAALKDIECRMTGGSTNETIQSSSSYLVITAL